MMGENPYQVLGPTTATLRGRKKDWDRLMLGLRKKTPSHISVVGPRYIGKTTLLRAVAAYFADDPEGKKWFDASVFWDLRHGSPTNDTEFYGLFAAQISEAVKLLDPLIGNELAKPENATYANLKFTFESLDVESKKILVIMDGLEKVLLTGDVSRNLWDNLRHLAGYSSLRFVTGTSRRLRELCGSHETKTSDFWEIFDPNPVTLGAFNDDDLEQLLVPFQTRGLSFERGAPKELANWSGGVPVLASALCQHIWESVEDNAVVTREYINAVAGTVLARDLQDVMRMLWDDCSEEDRGDLAELAQHGRIPSGQMTPARFQMLKSRGYVDQSGGAIDLTCRAVKEYAAEHGERSTGLRRLFARQDDFEANIKGLLELRFNQVEGADPTMSEHLNLIIQNINNSRIFITNIRSLNDRALELIWKSEARNNEVPPEWVAHWKTTRTQKIFEGPIPDKRGRQCQLLELMTGEYKVKTKVSRATYLLINHLQSVGDYGAHLFEQQTNRESIPTTYCTHVCFAAIELCERLTKDLADLT